MWRQPNKGAAMFEFLFANLPTILVAAVVFGIFFLILLGKYRDHKNGKGGCGCGCEHCANAGACHPKE